MPTDQFQCSSASRKFLNRKGLTVGARSLHVSVLFSEPKIPQCIASRDLNADRPVSVLFSEPKIPQSRKRYRITLSRGRFSALQRAENSSIRHCRHSSRVYTNVSVLFSEPKIPQWWNTTPNREEAQSFQCSSASRKFLNGFRRSRRIKPPSCFSALQRAENSSIPTLAPASIHISDRDDHASSFLSLPGASP